MKKSILILIASTFILSSCEEANDYIEGHWEGCRRSGTNEFFCAFSTFGPAIWWPVLRGFEEMSR